MLHTQLFVDIDRSLCLFVHVFNPAIRKWCPNTITQSLGDILDSLRHGKLRAAASTHPAIKILSNEYNLIDSFFIITPGIWQWTISNCVVDSLEYKLGIFPPLDIEDTNA